MLPYGWKNDDTFLISIILYHKLILFNPAANLGAHDPAPTQSTQPTVPVVTLLNPAANLAAYSVLPHFVGN